MAVIRAEPGANAPGGELNRKDDRFRAGCRSSGALAEAGSLSAAARRTTIVHRDHAGIIGIAPASAETLEFLAELFNASNRETDYAQALLKLFDLYCAKHDYQKAGECLDRAADVDPYEPGHQRRLESLRGKIDDQRFKVIASRFTTVKKEQQTVKVEEPTLGAAALQDLMLQAEILVQYGMRSKAIERLQRIRELFPREEEHNQELQRLYISAG